MDLVSSLRHARPFHRAPDDAILALAQVASSRKLMRGDALWRAGDLPTFFSVIYSGLIKIVRPLPSGREAILGVFGPRESVGDVAVLQGSLFPAAALVCTEFAHVIRIPREAVLSLMQSSSGLSMSITQSMGERMQSFHAKVDILSAGGVEARLAALLLDLAGRFGDDFDDGTVVIPIALSRQDLASLVSTSFETAIRIMSRWQKEGVLETRPDGFSLKNLAHLEEVAKSVSAIRPKS